jgi:tetratricopeptide (TPR) repeat protein
MMKKALIHSKLLVACLVVCLLAAGAWALRRQRAAAARTPSVSAVLASIPAPTGKTAVDIQIAKWTAQVRAKPKNSRSWGNLGDALMQKARETADLSYYGHAEAAYQKALDLDAKNVAALIGMAWVNGGRHEFEKSIAWANKALALNPQNNDAYGLIGDADVEMGNYRAAFQHYQQMIDLRPDIASYSRGAHLLNVTGNVNKGILLMAKAVNAGGPYGENTAWCRAQLALMLFNQGALPAADNTLAAALKLTPSNYQVLAAMGKVKAAEKDYKTAIHYYQSAIGIVPQIDSVAALGDLYQMTGDPQAAEQQFAMVDVIRRLQQVNGVRGDTLIARFYADHDRHLPEALRMAQAEYPTRKNVLAADTLAWCYYKNGRYREAKAMSEQALSQHTPDASFLFHAGMIAAKLGDRKMAQIYLSQAQSLNPNFSPVYAPMLVDTLRQLGAGKNVIKVAAHEEIE